MTSKQLTSKQFKAKVRREAKRLHTTIQGVHTVCYTKYKGLKMFMRSDTASMTLDNAVIVEKALAQIERANIAAAKAEKKAGKK